MSDGDQPLGLVPERGKTSVFLIGFMAAGKTTVGRLVARALGLPFVDLDDDITSAAGRSVAEIFAAEGAAGFRAREAAALAARLAGPPAVIAPGGGAAAQPANLAAMRRAGLVVALGVSLDVARARAGTGSGRPLLDRPAAEVADLYRERAAVDRRAHALIDTDGLEPAAVAARVVELWRRAALRDGELADSSVVALGERSYPVVVAAGALAEVGARIAGALPTVRRVALVSDAHVDPLHGDRVAAALGRAGLAVSRHRVVAGEAAKDGPGYLALCDALIAAGHDRGSAVVALGGGVVGDLAGFVAATLFRGVALVQLPTTLLAMIDSAIGGKTAIDTAAGKNLVGAIWQPALVLADPDVLGTLPARERRAGFGELLKYGLLDGEAAYAAIDADAARWADGSLAPAALAAAIGRCAAIKAAIVARDERELRGERQLLNLGHTVGHAIESAAAGAVHHGEAVALGLIAACRVSAALGVADPALEARVHATLVRAGLDADLAPWLRDDVVSRIRVDKKRAGADIGFVTCAGPGRCAVVSVPVARLGEILVGARAL
jgi:shikimate kinase/3-dehydroquinate synthase